MNRKLFVGNLSFSTEESRLQDLFAEAGQVELPAIQNVNVVDATGAGDAFNAGFIVGSEKSFEEAIRIGNICGALAVGERGGQAKSFGGGEVERQF